MSNGNQHRIRDLTALLAAKRAELRALERELEAARETTPLPIGVYWRRQASDDRLVWSKLIDVYVDGRRIGIIDDHSSPICQAYRPRGIGATAASLNAAIWLLLEKHGSFDRPLGTEVAEPSARSGGSSPPVACANAECSHVVEMPGRLCPACSDRLCLGCLRVHQTAFLIGRCESCRSAELVDELRGILRVAGPVVHVAQRGDN